jgi:hypothetical protein
MQDKVPQMMRGWRLDQIEHGYRYLTCFCYAALSNPRSSVPWRLFKQTQWRYFVVFRFAAQYAFMRSACALRRAALWRLRFGVTAIEGVNAVATGALGGLPLRLVVPCSAAIAWFNLSRSAISREMMWSVGMNY